MHLLCTAVNEVAKPERSGDQMSKIFYYLIYDLSKGPTKSQCFTDLNFHSVLMLGPMTVFRHAAIQLVYMLLALYY